MGEVYRAKDLNLGRAVSPQRLDLDGKPFLVERTGLGMSVSTSGTFVYLDFGSDQGQFFAWRDRAGNVLAESSEGHDTIQNFSLSPDGNRAVSFVVDGGHQSFWVYDLSRFARTRVDLGSDGEAKSLLGAYWLADDHLYYTLLTPPSNYQLRAKPFDGNGRTRTLPFPEGLKVVTDRTRDGPVPRRFVPAGIQEVHRHLVAPNDRSGHGR